MLVKRLWIDFSLKPSEFGEIFFSSAYKISGNGADQIFTHELARPLFLPGARYPSLPCWQKRQCGGSSAPRTFGIGTADSHFSFYLDHGGAAARAVFGHLPRMGMLRAVFRGIDCDHLGDHISPFFDDDPVADANIFALHLFLIVEVAEKSCCPLEKRVEFCNGRKTPVRPTWTVIS